MYKHAANLAIFSVGGGQGLTLTSASYNRFHNCFLLDCLLAIAFKLVMLILIGNVERNISAFLATLFQVVRPPILALGGVELPLPVLQWSERTERI